MGKKWATVSVSGYKALTVADDGTAVAANLVKFSTVYTDLTDPIKTAYDTTSAQLDELFTEANTSVSSNHTTVVSDHATWLEVTGTTTITLLAVATAGAGYRVGIKNSGSGLVTVDGNSAETIDGSATVTIPANGSRMFNVNAAGSGWIASGGAGALDPVTIASLTVTGDATIGDDLTLLSDASILGFGEHTDIKITHVHDSGLTFKNTSTADDTPFVLLVQTGETDIALDDALGKIQFQAPDEGAGTDAILVAAEIAAISEGDFSSSNNATKLSFKTAASGATSEKMSISSVGNVTMKQTATGDDTPMTLLLQTGETDIAVNDILGKIQFQAPDEGAGTDAILVAAEVAAVSEGDFAASNNATKLSFKTAASEAASEKMSLSSAGSLSLPTDTAAINFGADSDVLLRHVADSGLEMSVTGNNYAQLSVVQDRADASTGPYLNLNSYSASPANNDNGGIIQFYMENNADELFPAVQIFSSAVDVVDGTEDGKLTINTMKAGTSTTAVTVANTGLTTLVGLSVSGNTTLGDAASDTVTVTADVASHLIPSADSTYDIGATASRWRQGFFDEMEIGTNTGVVASSGNAMFMYYSGAGTEYGFEAKTDATTGVAVIFYHTTTTNCGSITVGSSATAYNTSSDYRLKENVTDMSGAITRVKALKPKRFSWIADEDNELLDGFLAHEVDDVVPQAIFGEKDEMKDGEPSYQGIDQSKLVPLLTGALQEAIAQIESLEARVAALET